MSPGPDGDDDVGLGVWNGKVVQWGRITLPKGPFRAISGSFHEGCGIRPDGHLACWGESRNVRAFATKLAREKIAMVSVDNGKACAVTEGRALFCLEALDGTPKPNRRLVRASGSFVAVDLYGFPWAVTSAGIAMQSEIGADFSRIEERVPGHFSSVVSDEMISCGIDAGKIRCMSKGSDPLQTYAPPALDTVERLVPGIRYFCALAGGRATCFGHKDRIPGGPLDGVAVRDVAASSSLLCLVDTAGVLRCRGQLVG
ncbi:hypothetical protein [Polyangium mundeleinium]|uniref:Uncharacterized protein n=1 Tax=Polyangium mundeleinium TaxID=2995306 RepID=A0ABT5ET42_9BACT|nr:hypothetical protein [Polyangium mundeleinium]MDC0744995.1 hypothetical protein [Polyangium mundeleinium]